MSRGRLLAASILALLVALLAVTANAQFGNPLKKLPKTPSVPGAKPAPPPGSAAQRETMTITDDMVQRYLKALKVQKEVLAKEMVAVNEARARAQAQKARVEALQARRAEAMVSTMMQTAECTDAFKEKDPRSKEIARLEDQVAAADEAGDEKKSDALHKRLGPLTEALNLEADRACGGKGTAALHDCMDKKKATLARQGITEPMLTVQAQGECMSDPATSGFPGATAASAEEQAAQREEEAANKDALARMANAQANAEKAGMEAAGLSRAMFAMVDHCTWRRLHGGPPCATDPNGVIDRYRAELEQALKQ